MSDESDRDEWGDLGSDDPRDREPRGPRGPATEAVEELTEAVEERNRQMRIQNAILAVSVVNAETRSRQTRREEPPTSYSYSWARFGSDLADALLTIDEEIDE